MKKGAISFSDYFKKSLELIKLSKVDYLLVGGIAVGIWGEPRLTEDIDTILFISKKDTGKLLKKAKKLGFNFDDSRVFEDIEKRGVFKIYYKDYHLDFLIASTKLEQSALERKVEVKIFGRKVNVPTKEDLLLLKVIAGREKDLLDAKGIALRHRGKLDKTYLERWAQKLSDEAEDMRIYNEVLRLLNL